MTGRKAENKLLRCEKRPGSCVNQGAFFSVSVFRLPPDRVVAGVPLAGFHVDLIFAFLFFVPGFDHSFIVHIAVNHGRGGGKVRAADRVVRGVLFLAESVQGGLVVNGSGAGHG